MAAMFPNQAQKKKKKRVSCTSEIDLVIFVISQHSLLGNMKEHTILYFLVKKNTARTKVKETCTLLK